MYFHKKYKGMTPLSANSHCLTEVIIQEGSQIPCIAGQKFKIYIRNNFYSLFTKLKGNKIFFFFFQIFVN